MLATLLTRHSITGSLVSISGTLSMAPLGTVIACYTMFVVVSPNLFHLCLDVPSDLLLLLRPYVFYMTILTSLIPLIWPFGLSLPLLSGAVTGQFGFSFPSPPLIFPSVLGNFSFQMPILSPHSNMFLTMSFLFHAVLLTTVHNTLPFTSLGPKLCLTMVLTFLSLLTPITLACFTLLPLIYPVTIPFLPLHLSSPFTHQAVGLP